MRRGNVLATGSLCLTCCQEVLFEQTPCRVTQSLSSAQAFTMNVSTGEKKRTAYNETDMTERRSMRFALVARRSTALAHGRAALHHAQDVARLSVVARHARQLIHQRAH